MLPHETIITDAEVQRRPSVQLDCTKFHRKDALTLWKNRLIAGLGVATILLGLWWWLSGRWSGGNSPIYSPGDVAFVHAAWETQCHVCHSRDEPAGRGWGAQTFGVSHTPDSRCNACHSTSPDAAYAPHHASQSVADTPTCAACHLEHRGRETMLTRMDDRLCTVCHADLQGHFQSDAVRTTAKLPQDLWQIRDWATHPDSRALRQDPGQLQFNHKMHLEPGIARVPGAVLKRWSDITDPEWRKRLEIDNKNANEPVQLDCKSCHETESDAKGSGPIPPSRAAGALMLPISYDRHCKECHPISVARPGDPRGAIDIPHGFQPKKLHSLLEGLIVSRTLEGMKINLKDPPWLLPGPRKDSAFKKTVEDEVSAVEWEMVTNRKYCAECHFFDGSTERGPLAGRTIRPTNVRDLWFEHARFNHAAHRMVNCEDCHGVRSSTNYLGVGILNVGDPREGNLVSCKQCHGTAGKSPGVRSSCVTCHTYHNGEHSRQGFGSRGRQPKPRNVNELLKPTQ